MCIVVGKYKMIESRGWERYKRPSTPMNCIIFKLSQQHLLPSIHEKHLHVPERPFFTPPPKWQEGVKYLWRRGFQPWLYNRTSIKALKNLHAEATDQGWDPEI